MASYWLSLPLSMWPRWILCAECFGYKEGISSLLTALSSIYSHLQELSSQVQNFLAFPEPSKCNSQLSSPSSSQALQLLLPFKSANSASTVPRSTPRNVATSRLAASQTRTVTPVRLFSFPDTSTGLTSE